MQAAVTESTSASRPLGALSARVRGALVANRVPILVALVSRVVVLAVFLVLAAASGRGGGLWSDLVEMIGSWDGTWYVRVARFGYDPALAHGNTPAFFPLWPLVLRAASWLVPWAPIYVVGSVLAQAMFTVALCIVYRMAKDRFGPAVALRAVLIIAFFPTAHAFTVVYSEGLFLLLVAGSLRLAERRHIAAASVLGMLATLTRPTGILLAPAIVLLVLERDGWRPRWRHVRELSPLILLPLALAGLQWYLAVRTGIPDALRLAQERGWGRGVTPFLAVEMPVGVVHALVDLVRGAGSGFSVAYAAAATLYAWLLVWAFWKRPIPLGWIVFAAGVVIVPAFAGTYVAMIRYGMGAFPFAVLLALLAVRHRALDVLLAVALPCSLVAAMWFTYGAGTFTP